MYSTAGHRHKAWTEHNSQQSNTESTKKEKKKKKSTKIKKIITTLGNSQSDKHKFNKNFSKVPADGHTGWWV
jgi:hypothetical protein